MNLLEHSFTEGWNAALLVIPGYILGMILGGLFMAYSWAIPHENGDKKIPRRKKRKQDVPHQG